jgi:hypothetical protein
MNPISGRPRFVAELDRLVSVDHLADQLGYRIRRVVELTQVADFSLPAALSNGHRVSGLGGIDSDERLPMSLHGSSPMR